jgi:hypothetical protein
MALFDRKEKKKEKKESNKKINDGEEIVTAPIAIAENIKDFSCNINDYNDSGNYGNYYLTNDNMTFLFLMYLRHLHSFLHEQQEKNQFL